MNFSFIQEENKNFTPARKIEQYAKDNGLKCAITHFFTQYIVVNGLSYTYDHYKITPNGDGSETVTIFLRLFD